MPLPPPPSLPPSLPQDGELQGYIHVEEMFSVAKCEEELSKDPKYRHCFEVNTQGRGYLFCADTENELDLWVSAFQKIVSSDAAENLVGKGSTSIHCCMMEPFPFL